MKHVTYAEKSLLVGDTAAELLLEYASAVGAAHTSDTVHMNALDLDGKQVDAIFLLGQGAPLMAETSMSDLSEPENTTAEAYLKEELTGLTTTPTIQVDDQDVLVDQDQDQNWG